MDTAMVVISPHFDDAVFSCGHLLGASSGHQVITVCAGLPQDTAQRTDWDARCGFVNAEQAVLRRRDEDRLALRLLGAEPVWLPFTDSQYGQVVTEQDVCAALMPWLAQARRRQPDEEVLFPLGLFHSDHLLTHEASLRAVAALQPTPRLLAYEDAIYRDKPGLLQARLSVLASEGFRATPFLLNTHVIDPSRKAVAVSAYRSQLEALGPLVMDRLAQAERIWLLERPDE
jgi:LmbE family N-acetylglucosaminyl deacetylase